MHPAFILQSHWLGKCPQKLINGSNITNTGITEKLNLATLILTDVSLFLVVWKMEDISVCHDQIVHKVHEHFQKDLLQHLEEQFTQGNIT